MIPIWIRLANAIIEIIYNQKTYGVAVVYVGFKVAFWDYDLNQNPISNKTQNPSRYRCKDKEISQIFILSCLFGKDH